MDASGAVEVLRIVGQVNDPRRHNRLHLLPEMIVMAVCAVLCGADSWEDVNEWCIIRRSWLAGFLTLPHGIPSHDTFGRVFARLAPLELERCLTNWMNALNVGSAGKVIAIDGKSLRRSFAHAWDTSGMAHMVSVFAGQNRLALAQLGFDQKEGELEAIKRLLAMVDLKGCTVSIDALGCQKEIAAKIVASKANYVLCVKQNQPQLHEKVKTLLKEARLEKLVGWEGSYHEGSCAGHGRIETRRVWYTTEVRHLGETGAEWPGLAAVAVVECHRQVNGQEAKVHRRYYILSDGGMSAERVGQIVRGHWSIENRLHYVLDVSFNEDQCRVRKEHGAENLSRLRRLTANLLQRMDGKASIRCRRKCCGWSEQYLVKALFGGQSPVQ